MAHDLTHILFEWEEFTSVEIALIGETHRYSTGPRSRILHRLAPQADRAGIPENAVKTPVRWEYDYGTGLEGHWVDSHGRRIELPWKLY